MNITEFAEQIVFSNSLEEKLASPGKLSFDRTSSAKLPSSQSLRTPGRPAHLLMQHGRGQTAQPPRDDQLENEESRGQLLHFLANHELLATELMALVLLKFPNAPRAFRQGVLVTLQEEQLHTRMYLKRMEECGVEFGAYPVSGQFWRIVEPMESPMDFVSQLSLTFEQANLDFSLHFSKVFDRIGDTETASLLRKIYEDEIGHVQHGLDWFRKWKDPDKSDWNAWQSSLQFPMTPGRGRAGPRAPFNRDGRRRAGLDDEFIDAIEVFGQSKDRSAVVRWFAPAAEAELAGDQNPKLRQLGEDLEFVTVAMSKLDDVILVRELPSQSLRKHWIDSGIELPDFCLFDELESLQHRKLNRFEPWVWTPKNHAAVESIQECIRHLPSPWTESRERLFRKSWGTAALRRWFDSDVEMPTWMGGPECVGVSVGKHCSLSSALLTIRERGFDVAVYKPELSASGRGMHRIDVVGEVPAKNFDNEIDAVVEPWLKRVVDLSFLWHVAPDGAANFQGWTRPLVSKGGRYEGTILGNPFADCDTEVRKFLLADRYQRLRETANWLESNVLPELQSVGFEGHFGIDAFVYREQNSSLKLRPFVELNPRMTMGHIALALEKRIANGVTAKFQILTSTQFAKQRQQLESIPLVRSKDGRWKSGVVWLGERSSDAKLIPCVVVGDESFKD
jgi:uncharacterized ferritin-like protein (DUF455 family)